MRKALVLGDGSRQFLAVVRSLGRGGVRVHTAWHRPDAFALRSRYVRQVEPLPRFDAADLGWRHALVRLMRRERFDLVLPVTDLEVVALQTHRAELESHGRIALMSDVAFETLFDKFRTSELARATGVATPAEFYVSRVAQAGELVERFGLPLVLKPRTSLLPSDPRVRLEVRRAYSRTELEHALALMLQDGPVAAQECVKGRGVGVELLLKGGRPLLAFQHERVHEPPEGGVSSYRRSVPLSPVLLDAALRMLRPLAYTGVAMVEFKLDPGTGSWALMEVNARFWGSLPLALAAGMDFPLALFRLLVEGREPRDEGYRAGLYARSLHRDLGWLRQNWRASRRDPTLTTRSLPAVLGEAVRNVALLRERLDTFALDDPRPALAELGRIARRAGAGLRARLSPPAAISHA